MTGQPCVKIPPIVGPNLDRTCSRRCLSKVAEETHSTVTLERFFAITGLSLSRSIFVKSKRGMLYVAFCRVKEEKQFESPATTRESTSLLRNVENTMEVDPNI
ncbi:hypothetical protein V1478_018930, partial [Vespula squamosa]